MSRVIVLVFRELRAVDQTALVLACSKSNEVLVTFNFDPSQYEEKQNKYFTHRGFEMLKDAVAELNSVLSDKLYVMEGILLDNLKSLMQHFKPQQLYVTQDYTPFAIKRAEQINVLCRVLGVEMVYISDHVLFIPPKPYKKFTPFYNLARAVEPAKPHRAQLASVVDYKKIPNLREHRIPDQLIGVNNNLRRQALGILNKIATKQITYEKDNLASGLHISAFLKYGLISIREAYTAAHAAGIEELVRQFYWRDFWYQLALHNPQVFSGPLNLRFAKLPWTNDRGMINKWILGRTGYPIVDAGMRELKETGYIHNRIRLVVACFLVKNIGADWRIGEKYFAMQLVDYDPAINNGNWQWVAGVGADAQPYIRTFNPSLQAKTLDPKTEYIRRWVEELRSPEIDNRSILQWEKYHPQFPESKFHYPAPMLDYTKTKEQIIEWYKNA